MAFAQAAGFAIVCIAAIGFLALAAQAFNHAASLVQPTSPTWITAYAVIKLGLELASWLIVLSISVFLLLVMVGGCDILLRTQTEREKKEDISRQTVEIADRVVDKQMRIVQEIASLLGETAAETKIALSKLKESISDE